MRLLLQHDGELFDWETGEQADGTIAGPDEPREGYFSYLIRTQMRDSSDPEDRGYWEGDDPWLDRNLETAFAVLVLTPRVFTSPCPPSLSLTVTDLSPTG